MPDLFYICVMMMGNGQLKVRAAIHGVIVNTIHSILSIPQIIDNGKTLDEWMDIWMNGWMDGWMSRWIDGWMNEWMNG